MVASLGRKEISENSVIGHTISTKTNEGGNLKMNSGFDKHFKKLMKNKTIEKEYSKLFLQKPISTQIAILRRERGLSQKQLADKLHMPQPAIARLERDNYLPNISTLSRLSKVLHCKIALIPQ